MKSDEKDAAHGDERDGGRVAAADEMEATVVEQLSRRSEPEH